MDITTNYDSLTKELKISQGSISNSGTNGGTSDYSSSTSTCDSTSSDSDSSSWSKIAQLLSNEQTDYVSPLLKYKSQNEALQQQLTKTLASKFDELGIDTSKPITLTLDSDGKVVVEGDNADKDKIEQLFADTDVLTQAFKTLSSNSSVLNSMTSQMASSMVRTNGYAAYLSQLASDSSSGDFYMSLLGSASTTYFG